MSGDPETEQSMTQNSSAHDAPRHALRHYLLTAEERAVNHALPSHIAAQINYPPRQTLETLVEAMFNGEATLNWEMECPHCQGVAEISNIFYLTPHNVTCKQCHNKFTVHADHEAQITFSSHPTLRPLSEEKPDDAYRRSIRRYYPPTTVHDLMTVQRFRDWAQNEPLPRNEYLEVQQTTLWFSDLTGSTALYARNGDPFAYRLVREHFDLVESAIQNAGGAIVKTIGDGVMAVFSTGRLALQAALDTNRELNAFNDAHNLEEDRRLRLKIGIHTGPVIVVTLNGRLDYFGSTVNIASRVSNLAQGEEIVLTVETYNQPDVPQLTSAYAVTPFSTIVRGLDEPIAVYRLKFTHLCERASEPKGGTTSQA